MSTSRPQKNPTNIPSFRPLINPKEETTMTSRFGETPAKESVWKTVDCKRKHMTIIKNRTIFLRILPPAHLFL
jgi:hypothetical protein